MFGDLDTRPNTEPPTVPPPTLPADHLPSAQRHAIVAAIVLVHVAIGWGLLQMQSVRETLAASAPLFVDWIALPAPEATPAPPRPAPKRPAQPTPQVKPESRPDPAPIVAAPSHMPMPALAPAPTDSATPAPPVAAAPPAPPPVATSQTSPPAPRQIPPSAIAYRVWPDVDYPDRSRRLGEQGLVIVAVFIDTDGQPRRVQIARSSGFDRLDQAALAGVRLARFKPYTENGLALAGWARIPIPFELEP